MAAIVSATRRQRPADGVPRPGQCEMLLVAALLALAATMLFVSSPHDGQFWWSDAPRHALDGAFVKDFVTQHPLSDPVRWAMQYYVRYPGLTILFYPPLFSIVLAPFYAVFGVSHASAVGVVVLHFFVLAFGIYVLGRRWLAPPLAALAGLAAMAAPGMAEWGRQVMLEIPTLAYAIWGLLLLRIHGDSGRPAPLYFGGVLLLCALYTKLNTVALLPVAAAMLVTARGRSLWHDRNVWIAAALFALGLVPLLLMTLRFGAANVQSVAGVVDAAASRDTIAGWLWYARRLTSELWWPLSLGACLWPVAVVLRPDGQPQLERPDMVLLFGWLVIGYLFYSAISLKDPRFVTQFVPPLLLIAMLALGRLLPERAAAAIAAVLVATTAWHTAVARPVPQVAGYREAAQWIGDAAPNDAVVVFAGVRDGSFIFNMRTMPRHDIATLRADKLLLDVAVRRELGVVQHDMSEAAIGAELDRLGVSFVVAQQDFWTDIPVMAQFQAVLRSPQFEEVARVPINANVPTADRMLLIYRNRHPLAPGPHEIELRLPIIGETVQGMVGR